MKKILVISGSPRPKGNTYKVTALVEEEMKRLGDVEFEYFFLKKANLEYCRGCLVCMKKGEENCPCKDDAVMLRDKMSEADGTVFISPVYVHTVSALMKNFYDRFAYVCHQPRFLDKAAIFIVTTELSGSKETLDYMDFPAFTWGFRTAGCLDVVYDSFKKEGEYRNKTNERISRLAYDFYEALTTPRKVKFKELVFFNVMKAKVTFHSVMLPRDYDFWKEKGWLERSFYHENNIPCLKSALAKKLAKIRVRKILRQYGLVSMNNEKQ